jgi:SSS family solute:Na+ symporter
MNQLSPIDVGVVVLYILGTTLIGAWFSRGQRDVKTYFVGDRNVSWWLVLVSIVATETSTVTFLSVPGFTYKAGGDFTFLQLCIGYLIGRMVIAWFLLPHYFRGELLTAYQLLRAKFGPAVQRTASGLFLVTRTVADGLRLFLTALLLQLFTGWDFEASMIVMGVATILYTYLGGMQAVIWTDLIQFVIYLLGAVVALGFIVTLTPGGWDGLVATGEAAGKFRLFDLSTDPTNPYTLLTGIIGGALFTMSSHGADQLMVQRYLCARSLGQARLSLVLSGAAVFVQFALFLLIGVGLYALATDGVMAVPAGAKGDQVFGQFIVEFLPVGLVGLVVAAVLAAAMSTLSSSLNSSANALVTDFYRPLVPWQSDRHYLRVARVLTLAFGAAQVAVGIGAYWLSSEQLIVEQVLSVAGLTTGLVLGLFVLGTVFRRVPSWAALAGLVAGAVAVLSIFRPPAAVIDRYPEWVPAFFREPILAWPWYAPVGTAVTVLVAILLTLPSGRDGPAPEPPDRGPQPRLDPPR